MMRTIFGWLLLLATGAIFILVLNGCDQPNEPDVPLRPYSLAGQYITHGTAMDVDAVHDTVAVADDQYGVVVLNVQNTSAPQVIFTYSSTPGNSCQLVALDPVHPYVAIFSADLNISPPINPFYGQQIPIFDYTVADSAGDFLTPAWIHFSISFSPPLRDLQFESGEDSVWFWAADITPSDGFVIGRMCRASDTSPWQSCSPGGTSYTAPRNATMRGFGLSENGISAIALDVAGIHLQRLHPYEPLGDVDTPGIAYDCAWYGSYIMVADQFQLIVVDAHDPMNPQVVSELRIPNADRLRRIVVDGPYACLMDEFDGVYVVDVSNPLSPQYAQLLELFDPTSLATDNNRLYVTDQGNGLVIYTR